MTPEEYERERRKSEEALRTVVEATEEPASSRTSEDVLGPTVSPRTINEDRRPHEADASEWNPPSAPDLRPVNASWTAGGPRSPGGLASLFQGSKNEDREAQVRFNADQVQLDNALVSWTASHFAATHAHFEAALSRMQRRMDDIDTRHRELERELVRHVHEMARRIDVVLGEGEKGRVSHEAALRSLRERLRALEEKLR